MLVDNLSLYNLPQVLRWSELPGDPTPAPISSFARLDKIHFIVALRPDAQSHDLGLTAINCRRSARAAVVPFRPGFAATARDPTTSHASLCLTLKKLRVCCPTSSSRRWNLSGSGWSACPLTFPTLCA